jgi:hypothetical protein
MSDTADERDDSEVDSDGSEIDAAAGEMSASDDYHAGDDQSGEDSEQPKRKRRRGRFFLGLILGGLAGAVAARRSGGQQAGEASEAPESQQDALGADSGGLLASFRSRWREASREANVAAREAEQRKHARFLELTRQDEQPS